MWRQMGALMKAFHSQCMFTKGLRFVRDVQATDGTIPSPEELRRRYPMLPLIECRDVLDGIPERVRQAVARGAVPRW